MRLLDETSDKSINNLTLLLTKAEAIQFIGYLELLTEDDIGGHYHLSNKDYSKEITLVLYDENDISLFNERYKKLIIDDE